MNVRILTLLLAFSAWYASANAPEVAYFVVKNETGMDITDLKITGRYAEKAGPDIGVDWNKVFHIRQLGKDQTSEQYTAQYNYGFGRTGQNYWYIRAELANGTGLAKKWDNDQPVTRWKQCSFLKSDKKKTLTIILKKAGKVKYKMPNSSDCDDKLSTYRPISQRDKLYSIGHMANTPLAISWAKQHEANAIEADLQFTPNATPKAFHHGMPSDCTLSSPEKDSICSVVGSKATGKIPEMFDSILSNDIPLFIIDTKVQKKWNTDQLEKAGREVANLVLEELFAKDYRGHVIIGVPKAKSVAYLKEANRIIEESKYKDRVFYSIDQEGDNFERAYTALKTLNTTQIAFGTGISIMSAGTYYKGIEKAVKARDEGKIKFVYIWTLDKKTSMKDYLRLNVDGVMTNKPGVLTKLIQSNTTLPGYTPHYPEMATINDPIPYDDSKNAADMQLSSN